MAAGGFLSASLSTDGRWAQWHLSRLGEGGEASALVFNSVSALCSLLMGEFVRRLLQDIAIIQAPKATLASARKLLLVTLSTVAVCMMAIAVFPFDRFPVIHNIFGYGMTLTFLILAAWLPLVLPIFSVRFVVGAYLYIVLMVGLFGVYFATDQTGIPLLYIEILGLLFFFVWLILLTRSIRIHNRASGS